MTTLNSKPRSAPGPITSRWGRFSRPRSNRCGSRRRGFQRSANGSAAAAISRWSRSAASSSNRPARFSPPARIRSRWSATSPRTPIPTRGCARGYNINQSPFDFNATHKEDAMNIRSNPDTTLPAVTTGPLPSSRKIFVTPDEAPDVRVPLREIMLSEGAGEPNLPVYDTSGPYTDTSVTIDVNAGLSRARIAWVKERGGVEEYQGRDIKPVDNGNVSGDHAAKAFDAYHKPLRGLDGHMITQLEFARAGIIT